jgi:hypothetical protein
MPGNQREIVVRLSHDEALVLFEWLHRSEDQETLSPFEHQAEQVALWNLSALLERALAEPFDPDYRQLVNDARDRLVDSGDHDP